MLVDGGLPFGKMIIEGSVEATWSGTLLLVVVVGTHSTAVSPPAKPSEETY